MRQLFNFLFLGMAVALFQGTVAPAGEKSQSHGGKGGDPKKEAGEPEELKDVLLKGKITKSDPLDSVRKDSHSKVHTLKLLKGYGYFIDLKADKRPGQDVPSFDTFLRLEDAAGKQLAENDDYITTDSRIIFSPEKTGQYRVVCTTFDAGATGSYTLTVSARKGVLTADGGLLVLSADGKLTKADPVDTKRFYSHAKIYSVKLLKDRTYQIDMTSKQFLTYVRVVDAKGKQLIERDDTAILANDTRLVVTPSATGDYQIIATTFAGGQVGEYAIKVIQR